MRSFGERLSKGKRAGIHDSKRELEESILKKARVKILHRPGPCGTGAVFWDGSLKGKGDASVARREGVRLVKK